MICRSLCLLTLAAILAGCPAQTESPTAAVEPLATPAPGGAPDQGSSLAATVTAEVIARPILAQPAEAVMVELATDALPIWRAYKDRRPTLALLSNDPFLQPIPADLLARAKALALHGSSREVRKQTAPFATNPVLLPTMALSAALAADFFAEVVWVVPAANGPESFSLADFRRQLEESGVASKEEAAAFQQGEGGYRGAIRGTPFRAVLHSELPNLAGEIVCHLDLSFFAPLYKNEVRTPLLPLLNNTLATLNQAAWPVVATTISLSNLDGATPLDSRFLQDILREIFAQPSLLAADPPMVWKGQTDLFYLANLFQYEQAVETASAMTTAAPKDAAAHYALYKVSRLQKQSAEALASLDRAVALDAVYALEYALLAPVATSKGRPDEAARLLTLAVGALPGHPHLQLDLAYALSLAGEQARAVALLDNSLVSDWSEIYYPGLAATLLEYRTTIAAGQKAE